MKKKTIAIIITFLLLLPLFQSTFLASAATEEEIQSSINQGLVWLTSQQNPDGSWGVIPVAICGTEEFDVTTIDPASVRLHVEGVDEGVPPLRWSYEDVATPYTGDPGGGHEMGGNGIIDLVFHFKTPEAVETLGLCEYEDVTMPLIIMGNLREEFDGTQIMGQDYVWLKSPKGKGNG
jgi:hypothetical protein